jgi:hypothetical protein
LTPSARSGNLTAGDGTKNGLPAPNKELTANPKQPLDRKSPIQVLCEPLFNARQTGLDKQRAVQEKLALLACYREGINAHLTAAIAMAVVPNFRQASRADDGRRGDKGPHSIARNGVQISPQEETKCELSVSAALEEYANARDQLLQAKTATRWQVFGSSRFRN